MMKAQVAQKVLYEQEKAKSKLANVAIDRIALIITMVLYDKFGFGLKKIYNCNIRTQDITRALIDKDNDEITAESLAVYAEKKNCNPIGWANSIPTRHKLVLGTSGKTRAVPGCEKYIESGIYSVMLVTIPVLKEQYKFSEKKMTDFFYWVSYYIESYALGFCTDKIIHDAFVEDLNFDITTWSYLKG